MNKALVIILIVVAVVTATLLLLTVGGIDRVAAECLRGNQMACSYWQASERVTAVELQLQEAKTNLATAREAYNASLQGGE